MRGKVSLQLIHKNGTLIEARKAKNTGMRGGGELIAKLFAGQGFPITHMGVGTSNEPVPDDFSLTGLSNDAVDEAPALIGDTTAPIASGAFTIEISEEKRVVTVKVRGTLPDAAAEGTIREAGLISVDGDTSTLYNRVTFAPLNKGNDHELTLFWEISFPYGDLQWF